MTKKTSPRTKALLKAVARRAAPSLASLLDAIYSSDEGAADVVHKPPASQQPARIACFSPYAMWQLHSVWELTVLNALARRGCDTRLVLCDAASPACDLFWEDTLPRWDRCVICQSRTTQIARLLRHPFEWLSRYVTVEQRARATAWATALAVEDLKSAVFDDAPLGEWVCGSVHSHFRVSALDMNVARVRDVYREYLTGAAVTFLGCSRLLDELMPDVLWLFNGRQSLTRVAFEAARKRGIRVLCHERGAVHNSLCIWENERCSEFNALRDVAIRNANVPLTEGQARSAIRWVEDRRKGRNLNWKRFVKQGRRPHETLKRVGVNGKDVFLLALTSSDDEFVAETTSNKVFPEQYAWIVAVIERVKVDRRRPIMIRFHPNTSIASWQYMTDKLGLHGTEFDAKPILRVQPNVVIIPPGCPLDTYALIDACAGVLVYGSTAGVEAAAVGKPVILADNCWYYTLPFVQSATSPEHFAHLLDQLLNATPLADEEKTAIASGALRFIWDYLLAPSIKSKRIRQSGVHEAFPSYRTDLPAELEYGADPGIDRITDIVLGRRPAYDTRLPGDNASAVAERAALIAHLKRHGVIG